MELSSSFGVSVIRAILLDYIFVGNYTRYEVRVVQAQKHTIPLLTREYLWTPGTKCRCPKLKISKEYLIMGNLVTDKKSRETKLQIDKHNFVRLFNKSNSKRLNSIPQSAKCWIRISSQKLTKQIVWIVQNNILYVHFCWSGWVALYSRIQTVNNTSQSLV